MAKKPKVTNTASLVMFSGSITVKGIQHDIPPVNYRRVETSDGKVQETGLPAGCVPGASIGDVIATAFGALDQARRGKAKKGASK